MTLSLLFEKSIDIIKIIAVCVINHLFLWGTVMFFSRLMKAGTVMLASCLASGLLLVNTGQATKMQGGIEISPPIVAPLNTKEEIPDYLVRAEQALRKGEFAVVLAMSNKVLALQAENITARALLAGAYSGLGNQEKYQEILSSIPEKDQGDPKLYFFSARANEAVGRFDLAEQIYKDGIQNSTNATVISMELAGLYVEQKKYAQASELYEKVLQQKNPGHKNYLNADFSLCRIDLQFKEYDRVIKRATDLIDRYPQLLQGYQFMATAYLGKGKPEQAVATYRKLLKVNEDFPEPYQELALIYMDKLGDNDKALVYAEQAAGKFVENAKSQDVLGWVLYKSNRLDRAVLQFEEAVRMAPDQAFFHYHLGLAELQLGNKSGAKKSFEEARNKVDGRNAQGFVAELDKKIKECGE